MATASHDAFPPIWRALGVSVAIGYAGLGSFAVFMPITTATEHGLRPQPSSPQSDKYAANAARWIGVRDIAIAVALGAFYYQEKPREMGTVILSGMIICAADCWLVYQHRQDYYPLLLVAGASYWGWVGWKLLEL